MLQRFVESFAVAQKFQKRDHPCPDLRRFYSTICTKVSILIV